MEAEMIESSMFKIGDRVLLRFSYPETRKRDAKNISIRGKIWSRRFCGESGLITIRLESDRLIAVNPYHPALIGIEKVEDEPREDEGVAPDWFVWIDGETDGTKINLVLSKMGLGDTVLFRDKNGIFQARMKNIGLAK